MPLHPDLGTNNPIVYLIKLISQKMQKEINEETSIVMRQKLEVRDKNLEAIYQSESNREKIKALKEAWANLKEKKEKKEKAEKGVSLYDKMIKWLGAINISLKMQDIGQLSNPVLAPGIIAAKITAFIEEQKKEIKYITRVAKSQKKIIKEDLEIYGKYLEELIDEINKGDDDYRQEILSKLDPWAQQDPYIADAPYNKIIPRYQERLGAHEIAAAKEQASGGKKLGAGWENELKTAGLDIRRTSSDLLMDLLPVETAAINVGDEANTDAAMEAKTNAKLQVILDAGPGTTIVKDKKGNIIGSSTVNMDPAVKAAILQQAKDAQSGKIINPFQDPFFNN